MPKLKRHTSYWIYVEGVWFESKDGSKSSARIVNTSSSARIVNTSKRAFAIASDLKRQYPDKEVTLTKFFFERGKRYGTDYVF